MNKTLQRKYARLIARTGANIQKKQAVTIYADVQISEFVTILTEECYRAGACRVDIEWSSQPLTRLHYRHRSLRSLSEVPAWKQEKLRAQVEEVPCRIHLLSEDPDGLRGVNREKMQKARIATYKITKPYSDALENKEQWTIAAVPSRAWAKRVFPSLRPAAAVQRLWEEILRTVYVTAEGDPSAAWEAHNRELKARCDALNHYAFDTLVYHSSNGTDFRVGLIPQARFRGGSEQSLRGITFNPNLPSEEVFTSPMRGIAEGTLVATMPLSYQGGLIENFRITFREGRAVSWEAEIGGELLDRMLTSDEGAAYLGEVALVPKESPISASGLLFYETLFDENASCHMALGAGYCDTIDGFEGMSLEECHRLGINESMIHVDFMIGAPDLSVTGYRDGAATPIFINGTWAFGMLE